VTPQKPSSIEKYKRWLGSEHGVDSIERHRDHYEAVSDRMRIAFEQLPLWTAISQGKLRDFDEEYRFSHANYPLFTSLEVPRLLIKSFDSFLEKTYRINVVQNHRWPAQPRWLGQQRWVLPHNWFNAINDIVRTSFIVKYFDGVRFLQSKLQEECDRANARCRYVFQAREEGHYAAHFYLTSSFQDFLY
jgi:hypothetical protein